MSDSSLAQVDLADLGTCLITTVMTCGCLKVFNSREVGWRATGSWDEASVKRWKSSVKLTLCIVDDKVSNGGSFEPGQGLFLDPWTWINPSLKWSCHVALHTALTTRLGKILRK